MNPQDRNKYLPKHYIQYLYLVNYYMMCSTASAKQQW